MYVTLAEYRIRDIDDAGWADACDQLAPALAAVPGLKMKYWLRGDADLRGGVYIWSDRAGYLACLDSDLGRALRNHPNIANLTMRDYAVDQAPTQETAWDGRACRLTCAGGPSTRSRLRQSK